MNSMISAPQVKTMSSREIAELTGKRHDHVIRDIRAMMHALGDSPDLGHLYEERDTRGYTACFHLDRYLSEVLVTGYDVQRRAAVIRRWMELEQEASQRVDPIQVLSDPAAMRGLLLNYSEKVLLLEDQVKAQAPKVEAFDRIASAPGVMCVTDAAKVLQVKPRHFFAWLEANRWVYRRTDTGRWRAFQKRLDDGHLQMKVTTIIPEDAPAKIREQVMVTRKGLARLAELIETTGGIANAASGKRQRLTAQGELTWH